MAFCLGSPLNLNSGINFYLLIGVVGHNKREQSVLLAYFNPVQFTLVIHKFHRVVVLLRYRPM